MDAHLNVLGSVFIIIVKLARGKIHEWFCYILVINPNKNLISNFSNELLCGLLSPKYLSKEKNVIASVAEMEN